MTPAELLKACRLAEMDVIEEPYGSGNWYVSLPTCTTLYPDVPAERAWIESRCASVLVGMVRKPGTYCIQLERLCAPGQTPALATNEQRIRAAYFAITGEDL